MKKVHTFVWSFIFVLGVNTLYAQEAQIPFDADGNYLIISPQIEKQVQLFTEYQDFREAKLFQLSADSYVIEIMYLKEGKLLRDRKPLDLKGFEELRAKFAASALFQQKTRLLSQDGRVHFLTTTTGWGAGFYGWALPLAFELESRQMVGTWMLISGSSFFVPFTTTKDSKITMSMARATRYGATRSFFHGAALYRIFATNDGGSAKGLFATAAVTSLAEMNFFYQYTNKHDMSEGRVEAIGLTGDLWFLSGGLASYVLTNKIDRYAGITALLGYGAGLVSGYNQTKQEQFSLGDVYNSYSTTFIGAYGFASIANIAGNNSDQLNAAGVILGGGIGYAIGAKMANDYDFSSTQGTYLLMSTFTGWATGLGAAYSFFGSLNESTSKPYSILSTVGSIGGYFLMFNYLKDDATIAQNSEQMFDWNVNPFGILAVAGEMQGNHSKSVLPIQAFNFKFRF